MLLAEIVHLYLDPPSLSRRWVSPARAMGSPEAGDICQFIATTLLLAGDIPFNHRPTAFL